MSPDAQDLSDLLEALRQRHAAFYYTAIALVALGVIGIACLLGTIKEHQ